MNIFSPILGPNSPDFAFASGSLGEPVQRLVNAAELLRTEIIKAIKFGSEARQNRLLAFKSKWEVEAQEIWGKKRESTTPSEDANAYSETMRQAVIAAVAIND